ncbi:sigma-70 family RNA polymerase sigma factor [Singulisphaera sp. PoT]|uniref:sigma-70 family RNA polymerase sigma factor n=1 Tax=Singulisphaera sp. PoT TaxID=3411797 RepID=UPI003BF5E5E3
MLLARHGPMVLGVCRRALHDPEDAADAFQATFLILARKADSVRVDGSLGRWLYQVSRRVAHRARGVAIRRAYFERATPGLEPHDAADDVEHRELLAALDEEVSRLPEPFRSTLVLCDLGGLAHEEAARQLGCAVGTVESRLSRARKRLRERLTRRGLAPMFAGAFDASILVVPEALTSATLSAAMRSAVVSNSTLLLMEGALTDMLWANLKTWTLSLGALALACALTLAAAQRLKAENQPGPAVGELDPEPKGDAQPQEISLQPAARMKPGNLLHIDLLEALPGRPLSGNRIIRPDGTISLGYYGDLKVAGLDRYEIKKLLIEHMRKYLMDDALGLVATDPADEAKLVPVAPVDSECVLVDESDNYTTEAPILLAPQEEPARLKPGDALEIEVLEALPGRPIRNFRIIRADGTISLGFYGDLKVAGLNRREIKVKVIERLLKYLSKESLGLSKTKMDGDREISVDVPPVDSNHVFVDDSLIYTNKSLPRIAAVDGLTRVKVADILLVEVLEALPGRPIIGEKVVRPDGTISLGFYGDLRVAGLNRDEIKVKLIEHLKKSLSDKALGLEEMSIDENGATKVLKFNPIDSSHVFVDESVKLYDQAFGKKLQEPKQSPNPSRKRTSRPGERNTSG